MLSSFLDRSLQQVRILGGSQPAEATILRRALGSITNTGWQSFIDLVVPLISA